MGMGWQWHSHSIALKFTPIDFSGTGDNTVVAAVPGKKIKVLAFMVNAALVVAARFKSGPSNNLTGAIALGVNGTMALATALPSWILETAVGEALVLNLGAALQVNGFVAYWDSDST